MDLTKLNSDPKHGGVYSLYPYFLNAIVRAVLQFDIVLRILAYL